MISMELTTNERSFTYRDGNGRERSCRARVWRKEGWTDVLIVSETGANPYTHVANMSEAIWRCVYEYLERPERKVIMIEQFIFLDEPVDSPFAETFNKVTFVGADRFECSKRRRMFRPEVEIMLGGASP